MIRILLADDHPIVRSGLRELLVRELEGSTCGEAKDAQEVLAQIRAHEWDLLILDVSMPGRSGLDLLTDLKHERPQLPVLVLTMHAEDQYGRRALKAGAAGFLSKSSAAEELIGAIRKVLSGGLYVGPSLAEALALDLKDYPFSAVPPPEVVKRNKTVDFGHV